MLLLVSCSSLTVDLYNREGEHVGFASFSESSQGVVITVNSNSLGPGAHGFHIHENGVCDGDFSSAGAHYNPKSKEHGTRNPHGPHAGDLPNVRANDDGLVKAYLAAPLKLKDIKGHSLIIHADPDDQLTDPSGNSGDRLVCGVI